LKITNNYCLETYLKLYHKLPGLIFGEFQRFIFLPNSQSKSQNTFNVREGGGGAADENNNIILYRW